LNNIENPNVLTAIALIKEKIESTNLDLSGFNGKLAFQFNLKATKKADVDGVFYVEVKDRKVNIEPYDYHDRDVAITTDLETLKKIVNGKQSVETAFLLKKIKVDGDIGKAMVLGNFLKK
jgi:putative sterol carrier protein